MYKLCKKSKTLAKLNSKLKEKLSLSEKSQNPPRDLGKEMKLLEDNTTISRENEKLREKINDLETNIGEEKQSLIDWINLLEMRLNELNLEVAKEREGKDKMVVTNAMLTKRTMDLEKEIKLLEEHKRKSISFIAQGNETLEKILTMGKSKRDRLGLDIWRKRTWKKLLMLNLQTSLLKVRYLIKGVNLIKILTLETIVIAMFKGASLYLKHCLINNNYLC